jgi:zinc-ribbon domain
MRVGNRFCGNCGHQLRPTVRFCSSCGRAVTAGVGHSSAQPGQQNLGTVAQQTADLPGKAPPGGRLPRSAPLTRARRRPSYLLPLVAVLAVFVAGGGSAAAVIVIGQSHGKPAVRDKLKAISPTSAPPASFSSPEPPTQVTLDGMAINIGAVNTDPDATAVAATLGAYFGGIDAGNYQQAWNTYSAALQAAIPLQPLANALSTSQDSEVVVQSIQHDANGDVDADVSFQSHQAGQYGPSPGETCTNWALDYHLVPAANAAAGQVSPSYLINKVTDIGAGDTSC